MKKLYFILIFSLTLLTLLIGCSGKTPLQSDNEAIFKELFHALEIYPKTLMNDDEPQYLDYIIHKYQLWNSANLKQYQKIKEELYTNEKKKNRLFLEAQDYKINPNWKSDFNSNQVKQQEPFLEELKQSNKDYYQILQNLKDKDIKKVEEAYRNIFPDKEFQKEIWVKNRDKEYNQLVRLLIRNQFEKEYQKLEKI